MTTANLPGRLGNPDMTLVTDPRADPRMVIALAPLLEGLAAGSPVNASSSLDDIHENVRQAEEAMNLSGLVFGAAAPAIDNVERSVEVIRGIDGNDITLFIHRPKTSGPVPAILHLHGGGMVMLEAAGPSYARWRDELANAGLVAVGVEFRNGGGKLGPHPFPAGLNDCSSALHWLHENRAKLGVSKIVVSGESGGGNLTLATTLKAKRNGRINEIAGVYAQCPYISNAWAAPPPSLPSLIENDDYFIGCEQMGALARLYDPTGGNVNNPLAWPLKASSDDLTGLPPHVISVNQLDPLRDEGLAYFRMLLDAGVSTVSRTVNGTCHAGDTIFRDALPDVYLATIRDIAGFANSL